MGDVMSFPDTFEEFAEQYKIVDKQQIYTNGTEMIPIFRVKQWLYERPTTNVVPKSEVENCIPIDVHEALKQRAKADAAREIFEEIFTKCVDYNGYIEQPKLAELKQKYTEV